MIKRVSFTVLVAMLTLASFAEAGPIRSVGKAVVKGTVKGAVKVAVPVAKGVAKGVAAVAKIF